MTHGSKADLLRRASLTAAVTVAALSLGVGAASASSPDSSTAKESKPAAKISEKSALGHAVLRVLSEDGTMTPQGSFCN